MNTKQPKKLSRKGFTMVEMLIVIAVIGIMSALVITAFSGAAQDTRRVISRQQQAAVQNAVNAWVNQKSSEPGVGLKGALTAYNAKTTGKARLVDLVGRYLDESTLDHFVKFTDDGGDNNKIKSLALKKTDQYLSLPDWGASSYPKVELK